MTDNNQIEIVVPDYYPDTFVPRSKTMDEILAARKPGGAWTKETLTSWGVPWPVPRGWLMLLASDYSPERVPPLKRFPI